VQRGEADLFIPLSYSEERARLGLFSSAFYSSFYAIIARRGSGIVLRNLSGLAEHRVGYVNGSSIEPALQPHVPSQQLHSYSEWTDDGLFGALRNGAIDLAV